MNFLRCDSRKAFCAAFALACLAAPVKTRADWESLPTQYGAYVDMGQVVKGNYWENPTDETAKNAFLTRTGVYLTYSATHDKKLDFKVTIGGLFWYPFEALGGEPYQRLLEFGPGVGQAQGIYKFGDPDHPSATLQFGLFPYKYNPDAMNLGEYLYRSGAYPTYIWNGGWSYLNNAAYMAEGAHFSIPTAGGKVIQDFTLFVERDIEPNGDLSPSYMVTVKPASWFEFGAGVEWAHALSLNPDQVTPENLSNAYSKITNTPYGVALNNVGGDTAYLNPNSFQYSSVKAADANWTRDSLTLTTPQNQLGYYTFNAIKTMARVSVDIGDLIKINGIAPGDFKLYGEWALLGVRNYPYYYNDIWERMPVMGGIDIPTFKILDKLCVEVEYHKSRWLDDITQVVETVTPLPSEPVDMNKPTTDWHWSIYARREITKGLSLYAQAASDHNRQIGGQVNPDYLPTTVFTRDWYYVLRVEFGVF